MNGKQAEEGTSKAMVVREGFEVMESAQIHETAAIAAAEQAKAAVQSRYVMALKRPRNMDQVRLKLKKECERPRFAQSAIYAKPVGNQKIEGLSIRFAEAAMRCMTNLLPETYAVYDDEDKLIIRVMLTDLENNLTYSKDITIRKVVERRKLKEGEEELGRRINSYGDIVYLRRATDDEMLNIINAQESKALRNHALRLMPGDILDECRDDINQTIDNKLKEDPDAERKNLVDSFAKVGVMPKDLLAFLGHGLDVLQPAELRELRVIYSAIASGEATWDQFVQVTEGKSTKTDKVKELLDKKKQSKQKDSAAERQDAKPAEKASKKGGSKKDKKGKSGSETAKDEPHETDGKEPRVLDIEEGQRLLREAMKDVQDVIPVHRLTMLLQAAALPVTDDLDNWSEEEISYGLYLLTLVIDNKSVPADPEAPGWMEEEEADAWKRSYFSTCRNVGLIKAQRELIDD